MRIAIKQPYFMPYIGYISLIKHTERFILFDTVQFIRHGWIERNRILKPQDGWQYIQVPVIKPQGRATIIKDVLIRNDTEWQQKILAQLQHYKKKSPYYGQVIGLLNELFSENFEDITSLVRAALVKVCTYLGINREIELFSAMDLKIESVSAPDEWALNICKAVGASEYWDTTGAIEYFNKSKYIQSDIELHFQKITLTPYDQGRKCFDAGLSILDVLMFNSVEKINTMLDNYELL
jgi:hypothetical protein